MQAVQSVQNFKKRKNELGVWDHPFFSQLFYWGGGGAKGGEGAEGGEGGVGAEGGEGGVGWVYYHPGDFPCRFKIRPSRLTV